MVSCRVLTHTKHVVLLSIVTTQSQKLNGDNLVNAIAGRVLCDFCKQSMVVVPYLELYYFGKEGIRKMYMCSECLKKWRKEGDGAWKPC